MALIMKKNLLLLIRKFSLHLLLLLSLVFPLNTSAAEKVLRVGVVPGAPFAIVTNNEYRGLAVDIWKILAQNLNIKYQLIPMSTHTDDDVQQLAQGKVDILVGPIIPTKERAALADFTRPFYLNQIGIVVPVKKIPFFTTVFEVLSSSFSWMAVLILLLFLLYIHIFWFFERRKNYMGVQTSYWPGIKTAFWIHTLGISFDQIPTHMHTRLFRFIWFVAFVLLLSALTATITSSLTVALSNNYVKYDNLSDLSDKQLVAVNHTAPYDLAQEAGLNVTPSENRDEAINLVLNKKVAGYVESISIADYFLRKYQLTGKLIMANAIIAQNTLTFAVPINSPIRHQLDLQLATIQANGQIRFLCESLLGNKAAKNCEI